MPDLCLKIKKQKHVKLFQKQKKIKLNAHEVVRENIKLNKNNCNLKDSKYGYEKLIFQMTEINLINHLEDNIKKQSEKIIIRWWEN